MEGCIACIENKLEIRIGKESEQKEVSSQTTILRLLTLETRINELDQRLSLVEKGKGKVDIPHFSIQDIRTAVETELANLEQDNYLSIRNHEDSGLLCNEDKKLTTIKILARIRIKDVEIKTLALLDPGCTSCLINKKIIPHNLSTKLPKPVAAMQMDGTHNIYEYYIDKAQISFQNTCNEFYKPTYNVYKILVQDLDIKTDLVIGFRP